MAMTGFLNKIRLSHTLYNWQTSIKRRNKASKHRKVSGHKDIERHPKIIGYRGANGQKKAGRYKRSYSHLL